MIGGEAGGEEPLFIAEGDEEMHVGVLGFDLHDGRVVHVVVVIVGNDDRIDDGDIVDLARDLGVALRTKPAE